MKTAIYTRQPSITDQNASDTYIGNSDHGLITFDDGLGNKLASWNVLGACNGGNDFFNNPQNVVETLSSYKERVLGKGGIIAYLTTRARADDLGAIALQEADFLRVTPAIQGVSEIEWTEFRTECEKRIRDAGFGILKSSILAESDEFNTGLKRDMIASLNTEESLKNFTNVLGSEAFIVPYKVDGQEGIQYPVFKDWLDRDSLTVDHAKQMIEHGAISKQGRGCAIIYNTEIYRLNKINTSMKIKVGAKAYALPLSLDSVSAEDIMYAHFTNKNKQHSLYIGSVHLDYKKSHSEKGAAKKSAVSNFAANIVKSLNTQDPVYIMGDWNAPCPEGECFIGSDICTNIVNADNKLVYIDPIFDGAQKNYDFVYCSAGINKDASFTADIFLPLENGDAACVQDGFMNKHGKKETANISETTTYYAKLAAALGALFILPSSLSVGAAISVQMKYISSWQPAIIKEHPIAWLVLGLLGTAAATALIQYGCKSVVTTEITFPIIANTHEKRDTVER